MAELSQAFQNHLRSFAADDVFPPVKLRLAQDTNRAKIEASLAPATIGDPIGDRLIVVEGATAQQVRDLAERGDIASVELHITKRMLAAAQAGAGNQKEGRSL